MDRRVFFRLLIGCGVSIHVTRTADIWFGVDLAKDDGVPYSLWAEQGLVTSTEGATIVIDELHVHSSERVREICARLEADIQKLDFHLARYRRTQIQIQQLQRRGRRT